MLQECFSDGSSSVHRIQSSTSARGIIGDMKSLPEKIGNPTDTDAMFQTAARLKATPIYRTADGAMVRFPQYAAHQLLYFTNPEEIQVVLRDLLDLTAAREVNDEWIVGLVWHLPLLKALFRLADTVVPVTKLLSSKSVCALVLEVLLTKFAARYILFQVAGGARTFAALLEYDIFFRGAT